MKNECKEGEREKEKRIGGAVIVRLSYVLCAMSLSMVSDHRQHSQHKTKQMDGLLLLTKFEEKTNILGFRLQNINGTILRRVNGLRSIGYSR